MKTELRHLICPTALRQSASRSLGFGCGPTGWKHNLVSDNIFLGGWWHSDDPLLACVVHDVMYEAGGDEEDRKLSDDTFLWNMQTLISRSEVPFVVKLLRRLQAHIYHRACRKFGETSFNYKEDL